MQASQRGLDGPPAPMLRLFCANAWARSPQIETGVEPEEDDASHQAWSYGARDRGVRLRNRARSTRGPRYPCDPSDAGEPRPGERGKGSDDLQRLLLRRLPHAQG